MIGDATFWDRLLKKYDESEGGVCFGDELGDAHFWIRSSHVASRPADTWLSRRGLVHRFAVLRRTRRARRSVAYVPSMRTEHAQYFSGRLAEPCEAGPGCAAGSGSEGGAGRRGC